MRVLSAAGSGLNRALPPDSSDDTGCRAAASPGNARAFGGRRDARSRPAPSAGRSGYFGTEAIGRMQFPIRADRCSSGAGARLAVRQERRDPIPSPATLKSKIA